MARRDDILAAVYEADRIHLEFGSRARIEAGEGRIDVFGMLVKRNVPVMIRPLKNLLGAFLPAPDRGVVVTSQRPLPVQRFTAAHELGHDALGHEASFDDEDILTRALFVASAPYDRREIQANAFATQLLAPWWLIAHHMRRQGWTRANLADPIVAYQLSLRIGASYAATCYALEANKGIDKVAREKLLSIKPKTIKQSLVGDYRPENWYGDVWLVTDRDNGIQLSGSRSDLVVFVFDEHASSGYLWQLDSLEDTGLAIRTDARESPPEQFGSVVSRTVIAAPRDDGGAIGHVRLKETRPWDVSQELHHMDVDVELCGPMVAGLLPAQRIRLLQSV